MFLQLNKLLLSLSLLALVAACGNGSSSSDDVGASSTDNSGASTSSDGRAVARLSSNQTVAGQAMTVSFDLGDAGNNLARAKGATGTIHWGDNTGDRISGNGSISHTYNQPGTFKVNIQTDGGPVTRLGSITVASAPSVDPTFEERLQKIINEANNRLNAANVHLARANRILNSVRSAVGARSRIFRSAQRSRNSLRRQRNNARRARNQIRNRANNAITAKNSGNLTRARNQNARAFGSVSSSENALRNAERFLRNVISQGQAAGVSTD